MPIHREADGTTQALSSSESDWVDLSAGTTSDSTGVELTVKATDLRRMVKNLPPPRWLQVNDKNYPDSKSYTEDEDYAGDEDYSHDEVDDNVDRVDFDLGPPHPAAPGALSPATLKFDDVSSKIPTLTAPDSTVTIKGKKQKQKITGTAPVVPHSSVAVEECLERERLKAFWISLDEAERRKLVKIEREGALKMLEEQQRRDCAHTASGGDDDTHLHTARNILAVLDDLLKNNGQKFLEVTGPLVEYWENQEGRDAGDCEGGLDKLDVRCCFGWEHLRAWFIISI